MSKSLAILKKVGAPLVLIVASCAQVQHPPMNSSAPAKPLVWPAPPEVARVGYVQTILRPADIGMKFSAFTRFGHWITGSEKGNEPFLKPFGLALDENENICLTDTGANAVGGQQLETFASRHRWRLPSAVEHSSWLIQCCRGLLHSERTANSCFK
jgi:hypothetical protein